MFTDLLSLVGTNPINKCTSTQMLWDGLFLFPRSLALVFGASLIFGLMEGIDSLQKLVT